MAFSTLWLLLKEFYLNTKCIIFDLDGTLVDSLLDLTNSMNYAMQRLNLPTHTPEEYLPLIGYGRQKFAMLAVPPEKIDLADKVLDIMWKHYEENCCVLTKPYPQIPEVIGKLKKTGIALAVLTNKDQQTAEIITKHYFGNDTFKVIVGATRTTAPKPQPDAILQILSDMNCPCENAVMVGDSEVDIQTGKNAKIYTIAATWGFRSAQILREQNPDKMLDFPLEIIEAVN
jgi:phosphoglycolate phosphatase